MNGRKMINPWRWLMGMVRVARRIVSRCAALLVSSDEAPLSGRDAWFRNLEKHAPYLLHTWAEPPPEQPTWPRHFGRNDYSYPVSESLPRRESPKSAATDRAGSQTRVNRRGRDSTATRYKTSENGTEQDGGGKGDVFKRAWSKCRDGKPFSEVVRIFTGRRVRFTQAWKATTEPKAVSRISSRKKETSRRPWSRSIEDTQEHIDGLTLGDCTSRLSPETGASIGPELAVGPTALPDGFADYSRRHRLERDNKVEFGEVGVGDVGPCADSASGQRRSKLPHSMQPWNTFDQTSVSNRDAEGRTQKLKREAPPAGGADESRGSHRSAECENGSGWISPWSCASGPPELSSDDLAGRDPWPALPGWQADTHSLSHVGKGTLDDERLQREQRGL